MDGFHFGDDWGTQDNLIVSPAMWRRVFKPRYRDQFEHAHRLGNARRDYHTGGKAWVRQVDVADLSAISRLLRGEQCFLLPVSYQTTSISGTPEEISREARRLYDLMGTKRGGFVGYVEEYGCMGMSEANYQASVRAFQSLTM